MYDQVKNHILGLSDAELMEYVVMGPRMYDPDAVAFAREQLKLRSLSPEQTAALREPLVEKVLRNDAQLPSPISKKPGVVCDECGCEVPNRYAEYRQNIGLVLVRISRHFKGRFCRNCNRRLFWKTTSITFFLGWWGLTSMFITVAYLIDNLITVVKTFGMPAVPSGSARPLFDNNVIEKVSPYASLITDRLVEQADPDDIAREIASVAGVTPGQAWSYVQQMRLMR